MVKIGDYQSNAQVFISSDKQSYNFSTYYDEMAAIKAAFVAGKSIEFDLGQQTVILYSPILQIMQINGDVLTVIFTAAEIPENKTKALEKRARELEQRNAELEAQLADAADTIEADSEAIQELAEMVSEIIGGGAING